MKRTREGEMRKGWEIKWEKFSNKEWEREREREREREKERERKHFSASNFPKSTKQNFVSIFVLRGQLWNLMGEAWMEACSDGMHTCWRYNTDK